MKITDIETKNYTDILPNGLTVVTVEMPHLHTLEIAVFIRAGLRFENETNNGVSHFLEHMMFRGNRKYPDSLRLNKEFEILGRELRASTLSEYTYFGFSPHISQLERAVEVFAEFFIEPTFPQIDLEREIILEEFLEELNEKGENVDIDNLACQMLYRGTPLAMSTIGTEKTIKAINKEMLQEFFQTYYTPGNMVLVGAGPIFHDHFYSLARRHFAKIARGGRVVARDHFKETVIENQKKPELVFKHDSDSQIQLQLCFRAVSYNDPDFYPLSLISRVFDDGFSSRLQRALREDRGLVYSVECRVTSLSDIGTIDFDVTVRPEKVCEVARILLEEIHTFLQAGPTASELAHVKRRYIYDLDTDRDDPCKQIVRYGFSHLYSRVISVEEEQALVEEVTSEEILRVARKIFVPEKMNLVIVGPYTQTIQKELTEIMNSFHTLPETVS